MRERTRKKRGNMILELRTDCLWMEWYHDTPPSSFWTAALFIERWDMTKKQRESGGGEGLYLLEKFRNG